MPGPTSSVSSFQLPFYCGAPVNTRGAEGYLETSAGQRSVTLYLGDGRNAPGQVCPDLMSLVNSNVHRVVKKSLSSYPVVFTEERGLKAFLEHRAVRAPDLAGLGPGDLFDMVRKTDFIAPGFHSYYLCALAVMPVFLARDFEFSPDQKLCIAGHGAVGWGGLRVDQQTLSMSRVAEKLVEAGVPNSTRDIRLNSCYSADAKRVPNLAAGQLDAYSRTYTHQHQLFGFSLGATIRRAPAEYLLEALREHGFDKAVVTGYHGAGVYDDGGSFPRSALRNASPSTSPDFDKHAAVRRSTVAHRFSHEVD